MERMMSSHHLLALAEEPGPWITITMPLEGGGPLARSGPIRYRNLLRQVDDLFEARATEPAQRAALIDPLRALGGRRDLFNAAADGLVVFASPRRVEHWHIPVTLEETARLDERPYLEPLIPLVTDPIHFYVVVLTLHQVRLLECSRFVSRELPLPKGTPTRLEEAAGWELDQDTLRAVAIGRVGTGFMFHGHGAGKDDVNADLEKYVRDVEPGLWKAIVHKGAPVVLVTSEHLEPVFRGHTRLPEVVTPAIHGIAEQATDPELHARALALVEPRFEAAVEEAKERLGALLGTGVATEQIAEVVVAAADGRVDTLFVREGAHVPGSFDAETHSVRLGDGHEDTTDLLDRAATDVFLRGGTVYRLAPARMPVTAEAAAILRY